jgi:NADH:ubiquinone oxidoreductase subunit K
MIMSHFFLFDKHLFLLLFLCNFIVFFIGLFGFLFKAGHYIYLIICNEIMLFSIILQFLLVGFFFDDLVVQIFVLFLLLLASAEVVIAFSLVIRFYKETDVVYIHPTYYVLD